MTVLGASIALVALISSSAPPPPPPPPEVRSRSASEIIVLDGETLSVRTMEVRLFGVSAPHKAQQCETAGGRFVTCGLHARAALEDLVRGQSVYCQIVGVDSPGPDTKGDRLVGRCFAGRTDLAQALAEMGYLVAVTPSPYAALAVQSCVAGRGVWAYRFEAPWTFKRRRAGFVVRPRLLGQVGNVPCAWLSRPS